MRIIIFILLIGTSLVYAQPQVTKNFKSHATYLASDELEGRGPGSKGIALAAKYIAKQFKAVGLKPYSKDSYYQRFNIPNQAKPEKNVIGTIPAAKPTGRSIVFTAHYDAYGVKKIEGKEDAIHNGAQDNAIGVAALIETARMFKRGKVPSHNLVFIATAAEEGGLHGSRFYVNNPLFPIKEITISVNFDGFNVSGPRQDFFVMPRQGVNFINEIASVGASRGWYYIPPDWVDGMNKSFDTLAFLEKGVPAFTLWTGQRLKNGKRAPFIRFGRIHTPDDEINELWNWDGVEDHLMLYKAIADYFLANPKGPKVTDKSLFEKVVGNG